MKVQQESNLKLKSKNEIRIKNETGIKFDTTNKRKNGGSDMQKLSAMKYIKNNKRRVAVLVVSLCLCFVLTYLTNFLLMATEETFRVCCIDNVKTMQYAYLAGSSLGIDVDNLSDEEIGIQYKEKNQALASNLKKYEGVKEVYYTDVLHLNVAAVIGEWTVEVPLVEKEQLAVLSEHYGIKLCEGRMPENPGEIVLDKAAISNSGYRINDYFDEETCDKAYKIVGILDSESYLGYGILTEDYSPVKMITILSDGSIKDLSKLLEKEGISVRDTFDNIVDVKQGEILLKQEVTDVIGTSINIVYIVIIVLLSLALFIVYTMYLRDRHNEWCLYCSIGYSRKEIYHSIMRELLFSFGLAVGMGLALIVISVVAIDFTMLSPAGIKCRYFYPQTLVEILCSFALLLGVLQIPVRYALHRIKTIDAMEDDLY